MWYTGIGSSNGIVYRIGYATNLRYSVTDRLYLPALWR
jgi:hypothetical protein